MSETNVAEVIDAAVVLGMINDKQAGLLKEELFMFPGLNPLNIMIRRGIINADQSQTLSKVMSGEIPLPKNLQPSIQDSDEIVLDFDSFPVKNPNKIDGNFSVPGPQPPFVQAPPNASHNIPKNVPPEKSRSPFTNFGQPVNKLVNPMKPQTSNVDSSDSQLKALKAELTAWKNDSPTAQKMNQGSGVFTKQTLPKAGLQQFNRVVTLTPSLPAPQGGFVPSWKKSQTPIEHPQLKSLPINSNLADYLSFSRAAGCSDLHISVDRSPFVRWQGQLYFLDSPPLTASQTESLLFSALSNEQATTAKENHQLDFAFELAGIGRHRANIYKQRIGWDGAFRIVSSQVPSLEDLEVPKVLSKLTQYHQGLILVTGPAGCGKTTTVASMIDYINKQRSDHIITVEDPVEYVIHPDQCQVTQREVGPHTQSFSNALRAALRQDPDVIMVGELRDLETTSIAISAAETGHLVLGTLHTSSAIRTVARIMDVYPPSQRAQICLMVAESLRGIISQQLIPRKDQRGRVAAMEILLFTTGVAQIIKEGKTHQLLSHMQAGRKLGMKTMDDALLELVETGLITGDEGYLRAENKAPFTSHLGQR